MLNILNNSLIIISYLVLSMFWQFCKKANIHAELRALSSFHPQIYPQKMWINPIFSATPCG